MDHLSVLPVDIVVLIVKTTEEEQCIALFNTSWFFFSIRKLINPFFKHYSALVENAPRIQDKSLAWEKLIVASNSKTQVLPSTGDRVALHYLMDAYAPLLTDAHTHAGHAYIFMSNLANYCEKSFFFKALTYPYLSTLARTEYILATLIRKDKRCLLRFIVEQYHSFSNRVEEDDSIPLKTSFDLSRSMSTAYFWSLGPTFTVDFFSAACKESNIHIANSILKFTPILLEPILTQRFIESLPTFKPHFLDDLCREHGVLFRRHVNRSNCDTYFTDFVHRVVDGRFWSYMYNFIEKVKFTWFKWIDFCAMVIAYNHGDHFADVINYTHKNKQHLLTKAKHIAKFSAMEENFKCKTGRTVSSAYKKQKIVE